MYDLPFLRLRSTSSLMLFSADCIFSFFQLLGRLCWFTSKRNEEASAMARSLWWASAIISSLYFRTLIFCEEIKGLIVIRIGTFYFNGALSYQTLCSMQQDTGH